MDLQKLNTDINTNDQIILDQLNSRPWWESNIDLMIGVPFIKRNLHLSNKELANLLLISRSAVENIMHKNKIKRTEEHLKTIREKTGKQLSGEQNGNWKGGVSTNHYTYKLNQKEKWPEKLKARNQVRSAIKSGRVSKESCFICGVRNSEAHHHKGYDQPLSVMFLCKSHHRVFDIFQRAGLTEIKEFFLFVLSVKIFLYKTGSLLNAKNN